MSKLRGGLYGCGMISEFHLRGWRRIPEVKSKLSRSATALRAARKNAARSSFRRPKFTTIWAPCCETRGSISWTS